MSPKHSSSYERANRRFVWPLQGGKRQDGEEGRLRLQEKAEPEGGDDRWQEEEAAQAGVGGRADHAQAPGGGGQQQQAGHEAQQQQ